MSRYDNMRSGFYAALQHVPCACPNKDDHNILCLRGCYIAQYDRDDGADGMTDDQRDSASVALNRWLDAVREARPDGEQDERMYLRFRAEFHDGHCYMTVTTNREEAL